MKEFDNISTEDLKVLLNEDTILKRFYPLIPIKGQVIHELLECGIQDKYMYFEQRKLPECELNKQSVLGSDELALLDGLFQLYDFKNRKLIELKSYENQEFLKKLISNQVKASKDYMMMCMTHKITDICTTYHVSIHDIKKLFALCDLMRLPGVKDIRASLYYESGYHSIADFAKQSVQSMQETIGAYIERTNQSKAVPLKKELSTQIAVAKVLPVLRIVM